MTPAVKQYWPRFQKEHMWSEGEKHDLKIIYLINAYRATVVVGLLKYKTY